MKIDVEGYELEVLKGARGVLDFDPIIQMEVHDEPVADHWLVVRALDDVGRVVDQARCRVGRFTRPKRREATPIERVRINERGYLEVNGKLFYAVIASLRVEDLEAGYLKTPRLGFNGAKMNCGPNDQIVSTGKGSVRGVYTELYKNGVYATPFISMTPKDHQEEWMSVFQLVSNRLDSDPSIEKLLSH